MKRQPRQGVSAFLALDVSREPDAVIVTSSRFRLHVVEHSIAKMWLWREFTHAYSKTVLKSALCHSSQCETRPGTGRKDGLEVVALAKMLSFLGRSR